MTEVDMLVTTVCGIQSSSRNPTASHSSFLQHTLGIYHDDSPPRRVVIRFAPEVARYVEEHRWHGGQQLTRHKDGSLRAEFELASLQEVKAWVLSFGSKAVVEEPAELREEILAEARRLLEAAVTQQTNVESDTMTPSSLKQSGARRMGHSTRKRR